MKILLATDGSEFSRAAIEKCCHLVVKPENSEIKLISVFEDFIPVAAEPFMVSAEYIQEMDAAGRKMAHEFIAKAEKQIGECLPDIQIELSERIVCGSPERAILEEAERWKADLIVMGSHGRGFWKRMFMGSVSQSVMQHAPCSVLIVRKHEKTNGKN